MAWTIDCTNCGKRTRAANIVELTERHSDPSKDHLDPFGWFLCRHCKSRGYIEKHYKLQEPDRPPWKPYLRVALRPSHARPQGHLSALRLPGRLLTARHPYRYLVLLLQGTPETSPADA